MKVVYEAFKGLILLCYHAHVKLNLIPGTFHGEVLHQMNSLPLSEPSVLCMDIYIFQPGLKISPADEE